jgi:hypothetical protein
MADKYDEIIAIARELREISPEEIKRRKNRFKKINGE